MGALNAGDVGRNRDSEPISGFVACCQLCDRQVLSTPNHGKLTLTASKRRSLLMGVERRRRNDKKSQRYAKNNRTAFNCTQ